jgi:outer membrane autotransporter protein
VDIEVEPNTGSIRPVAGITIGNRTNDGWTELGSIQSAISHAATDENYTYATFGLNFDLGIGTANISRTTEDTTRLGLGIDYLIKENISINADINRNIQKDVATTGISAGLTFIF